MSKQRESNIELLRVISIFLVLVVHANMLHNGIGAPGLGDLQNALIPTATRVFFISIAYICVDVFIIISGWYGIHASLRGICKLMFMCLFLGMIGYGLNLYNHGGFSIGDFIKLFFDLLFPGWFIASYMVMYLLSPIINAFIETRSERQVRYTVIGFFAFEFIYGWIFPEGSGNIYTFNNGYSALSLIGLYILARYLRVFIYDQRKRNRISKAFTMGGGNNVALNMGKYYNF